MNNEKRILTSKNSQVKCLVDLRNKKEIDLMNKTEKEYRERMENFQVNSMKNHQEKESLLLTRSMVNETHFKDAAKRRQECKNK